MYIKSILLSLGLLFCFTGSVFAIESTTSTAENVPATSATNTVTSTAEQLVNQAKASPAVAKDVTKPEELPAKVAVLSLFEKRSVTEPSILNFFAYWVQESIRLGVPSNTIFLILLVPIIATLVSFTRVVIGLPTLELLVPIALAFAFVAVGIVVGLLILVAILVASYVARYISSKIRIMYYPKRSLSMLFLSIFVFAALTVAVTFSGERVLGLSIFPIIILTLLGDSIVSVQLYKSASETFVITMSTLLIGLIGFALATNVYTQNTLILYPEIVLLTIPANILIGRYFGLRVLERFRFSELAD